MGPCTSLIWRVSEKHMTRSQTKEDLSKDKTIRNRPALKSICSGWMTQTWARESATNKSAICLSLVSMPSIRESSGGGLCSSERRAWLLSVGCRVHDVLHLGRVTSCAEAMEGSPCFEIRHREMNFDLWDRLVPAETSLCCRDGGCFFVSEGLRDLSGYLLTSLVHSGWPGVRVGSLFDLPAKVHRAPCRLVNTMRLCV